MILSRELLRSAWLSGAGAISGISPSVHILAGHILGREITKSRAVFSRLLDKIAINAELVDIAKACELIRGNVLVEKPHIAFTFDDGFEECYTHIAPELEARGVNAAFFINPNFVTGDEDYIRTFCNDVVKIPGKRPMRSEMIRDLATKGFVIGAHTLDHADLSGSNSKFLHLQIADCRHRVEDISGAECDTFAWTFGNYRHISTEALDVARRTYGTVFSSDRYHEYGSSDLVVLNRRHFECDWKFSHVKYFLSKKRSYV